MDFKLRDRAAICIDNQTAPLVRDDHGSCAVFTIDGGEVVFRNDALRLVFLNHTLELVVGIEVPTRTYYPPVLSMGHETVGVGGRKLG